MRSTVSRLVLAGVVVFAGATGSPALAGQAAVPAAQAPVPPLIKFTGALPGPQGARAVTFRLFAEQTGGAALWAETQTVVTDADGRYVVTLGARSAEGVPLDLFTSGEARWLEAEAEGTVPQVRVLLVSVPYAMKAADATTVGGKPLSAFVLAGDKSGVGADGLTYVDTRVLSKALGAGSAGLPETTGGNPGYIGMFTDTVNLGNSVIYQSGTSIGVNTTVPEAAFHVKGSVAPSALFDVYSNSLTALPAVYRAARGTVAAPAAVGTDDILGGLAVRGHNGSGFTTGRGQVMFKAAENWTPTANGTYLQFTTTPTGSVTWVERMRIAPNGNVGIGTFGASSPAYPLDIPTSSGFTYAAFGKGSYGLFLTANFPQIGFNLGFPQGAGLWTYGSTHPGGYIAFGQDGDGAMSFATAPSGTAGATVVPNVRMLITNDGNVGIGTPSPASKLDVAGDISATGATFSDPVSGGTAVSGFCNGASCYGLYGNTADGQGVRGYSGTGYGVYGNTSTGTAGRFNVSNSAGKVLSGTVVGTEVFAVDSTGVRAGPAMTRTPLAHALVNTVAGHELDYTKTSNVTAAAWTGTGVCEVTISGVTLDYYNYTVIVTPYSSTGGIVSYEVSGGKLIVYTYTRTGVASSVPFTFIIMAM